MYLSTMKKWKVMVEKTWFGLSPFSWKSFSLGRYGSVSLGCSGWQQGGQSMVEGVH